MKVYGHPDRTCTRRKDRQAKAEKKAKAALRAVGIKVTTDSPLQGAQDIARYLTTKSVPGNQVKGSHLKSDPNICKRFSLK